MGRGAIAGDLDSDKNVITWVICTDFQHDVYVAFDDIAKSDIIFKIIET